jgi:hypothetical protein
VLFVHELHEVVGAREDEFETALREAWMPGVARDGEAALLYFLHHAHGTGASYRVVTITAVRDGAAWQRLIERVDGGDLAETAARIDGLRHDVTAKVLVPLAWSPLQEVTLPATAPAAERHEPTLFMEDTVWPHEGRLEEYVARSGSHYANEMADADASDRALLRIQASFRTAYGGGRRREIVLWQKLVRPRGLRPLISMEVPPEYKAPGGWMHDALEVRDRWESRLLRSARWSPWY